MKQSVLSTSMWEDFTPELWSDQYLKHLHDAALPFYYGDFLFDPLEQKYAFQLETQEMYESGDEDLVFTTEPEREAISEEQVQNQATTEDEQVIFSPVQDEPGNFSTSNACRILYITVRTRVFIIHRECSF